MNTNQKWRKIINLVQSSPTTVYRLGRRQLDLKNIPHLYYVTPNKNWVTDRVGYYITSNIRSQFNWSVFLTDVPHLLIDHIIHYGELGGFLHSLGTARNRYNTIVATIFHGDKTTSPEITKNIELFIENIYLPVRILTACQMMRERLLGWGASPEQVVYIPLGVDLNLFTPPTLVERMAVRRKLGIPDDAVCIGSFQKDGVGWADGLTPKLIKGPDIFLKVIERLHQHYNLFVLLTGPARGYVKQGLDKLEVPYHHEILASYQDIVSFYHCLDIYLVCSREEGGPKAVLETLATSVPLVSTKVGLAPDIINHTTNGLLTEIDDVEALTEAVATLIDKPMLRQLLAKNGLKTIVDYDWRHITTRYYTELYLPILQMMEQ